MDAASDILLGKPQKQPTPPSPQKQGPQALFKTLRRLHGQNLDHQGLNDLTEQFQSFVTRARFFAIGRVRRTWSHSALEFMKYRRRLPALLAPGSSGGIEQWEQDALGGLVTVRRDTSDVDDVDRCKIQISNVSSRVTAAQLASFFSKYGDVAGCQIPVDSYSSFRFSRDERTLVANCGTIPRRKAGRTAGIAYVTYKRAEDADKAKSAPAEELRFHGNVMIVHDALVSSRRSSKRHTIAMSIDDDRASMRSSSISIDESSRHDESISDEDSPMDQLSDDVLTRIIDYLTVAEKIRIERVSKRFLEVAALSWAKQKRVCLSAKQLPRGRQLLSTSLKCILRRCGSSVQCLGISQAHHLLDDTALSLIGSHCTNLKKINVSGLSLTAATLEKFAEQQPGLEAFVCEGSASLSEKCLFYLFRHCRQLHSIELAGCKRINGLSFRLVAKSALKVDLSRCARIEPAGLSELCMESPKLAMLALDDCTKLNDECLGLLARTLHDSLIELSFSFQSQTSKRISSHGLLSISRMSELRSLKLHAHTALDDDVLAAITNGAPRLHTLDIGECGSKLKPLSEKALLALHQLTELKHLNISRLFCVTDTTLLALCQQCRQLRTIVAHACTMLRGHMLTELLRASTGLVELDLSGSVQIDTDCVRRFIDAVIADDRRTEAFTLVLGGTSVDLGKVSKSISPTASSKVLIDWVDYSSSALAAKVAQSSKNDDNEDEDSDDDDFESIAAQRSFIMDTLDEDDLLPPDDASPGQLNEHYASMHLGGDD